MLKKYLQALLEAFIGSKKEWVSQQSAPAYRLNIDVNETSFIAPATGTLTCLFFNISTVSWDIFQRDESGGILSRDLTEITHFGSVKIEVRKGATVYCESQCRPSEMFFTYNEGEKP